MIWCGGLKQQQINKGSVRSAEMLEIQMNGKNIDRLEFRIRKFAEW